MKTLCILAIQNVQADLNHGWALMSEGMSSDVAAECRKIILDKVLAL